MFGLAYVKFSWNHDKIESSRGLSRIICVRRCCVVNFRIHVQEVHPSLEIIPRDCPHLHLHSYKLVCCNTSWNSCIRDDEIHSSLESLSKKCLHLHPYKLLCCSSRTSWNVRIDADEIHSPVEFISKSCLHLHLYKHQSSGSVPVAFLHRLTSYWQLCDVQSGRRWWGHVMESGLVHTEAWFLDADIIALHTAPCTFTLHAHILSANVVYTKSFANPEMVE